MTSTSASTASVTDAYRASRDQLLELRTVYARAVQEFAFPDVGDRFNWAIDWFDVIARGNDKPGLTIVQESDSGDDPYQS